jgi:hypothetical protein
MSSVPIFRRSSPSSSGEGRAGIIDIGSNSIRLVIYDGPARIPAILFNEKVMAGLGKGVSRDGMIDPQALERALVSLARFQRLSEQMGVPHPRTVATAAVREASNGRMFLDRVLDLGLQPELLSGEDEARMAGLGVLAAIPEADGIVGDLGGGSLELVRIGQGVVHETSSFPLGVLRLDAMKAKGPRAMGAVVAKARVCHSIWSADRGDRSRGSICTLTIIRCRSSTIIGWSRPMPSIWCGCSRSSIAKGCVTWRGFPVHAFRCSSMARPCSRTLPAIWGRAN